MSKFFLSLSFLFFFVKLDDPKIQKNGQGKVKSVELDCSNPVQFTESLIFRIGEQTARNSASLE